ncbi:MAG: hypothetical protein WEE50_07955 [Chloroflexota bacterium]
MPSRFSKEAARLNGASQDQQHPVDLAVPLFELHPASDGLRIARGGLGLNAVAPGLRADQGIPGPLVTGDWKRHLNGPPQGPVKLPSKVVQQLDVRRIADGLPGWIRLERQVEADDSVQTSKITH